MKKIKLVSQTEDTTLETLFEDYLNSCEIRGLSARTLTNYKTSLECLFAFLQTNNIIYPKDLTIQVLENYIKYLQEQGLNPPNLNHSWTSKLGLLKTSSMLLVRALQGQIQDYNIAHGVSKTSAHLFRSSFAKAYILNGGDAFRLQKLLGHANITTTQIYVNMFGTDLQRDFDKFNPLDNLSVRKDKIKV